MPLPFARNLRCRLGVLLFLSSSGVPTAIASPPAGGLISVDPATNRLVDEDGRERIFHGTNIVYKGAPYFPPTLPHDTIMSFGPEDMKQLRSWGWNNVRLGLLWAGAEPTRGHIDMAYLQRLRNISDELGEYGIYTYIELHQDVLAERFCGDGIPTWAAADAASAAWQFPKPVGLVAYTFGPDGLPREQDCANTGWANYYASNAVGVAFQSLYDNANGIRDALNNLWRAVADVFKDSKWLIGYELMNEPWAGNHLANPKLMYPGVADKLNLAPFYETNAAAIRSADKDHTIMFEPLPWDNFAPAGFDEVPGGSGYRSKSILAYHYYFPPDLEAPDKYFGYRMKDVSRLQCGGFLTEFATTWPVVDPSGPHHDLDTVKKVVAAAENNTQSWSGWQYKVFHPTGGGRFPHTPGTFSMFYPDGTLDSALVNVLSQPYARAVAGRIVHNSYAVLPEGPLYELHYVANGSCRLSTEIWVNQKIHFPSGVQVHVEPPGIVTVNVTDTTVELTYTSGDSFNIDGTTIMVAISNGKAMSRRQIII